MTPDEVLSFWFVDHGPDDWFGGPKAFDDAVKARLGPLQPHAERCELFAWRATPQGRLAEILLLDQVPRQLYRGQARAFASDPLALGLAQEAIAAGHDQGFGPYERQFLYMPYMHSESLSIHDEARLLYAQLPEENGAAFEEAHRKVIERFGRYPHRNAALGRQSTQEELDYIAETDGF
ncbi:MAG: DUF924 family protein [Pseudomonadota bacterium]